MAVEAVMTEQPSRESRGLDNPIDEKEEEKSVKETCNAFCQCLCSIWLCFLFPFTSRCCKCVMSYDDDKISWYLANGPGLLAGEIWKRFSTSFSTYSTNMTTLLKEPIQNEDMRFFRIKASLTSIFVPCVVGDRSKPHTYLFVRNLAVLFTTWIDLPVFLRERISLVVCTSDQNFVDFNITEDVRCVGPDCLDFCNPGNDSKSSCFTQRFRQQQQRLPDDDNPVHLSGSCNGD